MHFDLKIKNFGKLNDATIRIGKFTVLAGPNNTGKSYVSKLLYSIFDAMNANHIAFGMFELTRPIKNTLVPLERPFRITRRVASEDEDIENISSFGQNIFELRKYLNEIEELAESYSLDKYESEFEALEKLLPYIRRVADKMQDMPEKIEQDLNALLEATKKEPELKKIARNLPYLALSPKYRKKAIQELSQSVAELKRALQSDAIGFILEGLAEKIRGNLLQNFQVAKISDLHGQMMREFKVDIENIGTFEFEGSNAVRYDIEPTGLQQLQAYSRVIYLESPLYWKLKSALEESRGRPPRFLHSSRSRLSGVPGYFYDLVMALEEEYTGDIAFPKVYKKLTSQEGIGGKMAVTETGELRFIEGDRSFSLHQTAMGATNLGMLALLIERKIIDKGAFLFIDEPEAHLHPAWQIKMAESLFALAKGGVNVVIATHSADILKWLEVHVKKHPKDQGLIALNKFPAGKSEDAEQDFQEKIASIKQELTKPFADLYMSGL